MACASGGLPVLRRHPAQFLFLPADRSHRFDTSARITRVVPSGRCQAVRLRQELALNASRGHTELLAQGALPMHAIRHSRAAADDAGTRVGGNGLWSPGEAWPEAAPPVGSLSDEFRLAVKTTQGGQQREVSCSHPASQ